MKLDVENEPTITEGDRLRIRGPGQTYMTTVLEDRGNRIRCRDDPVSSPIPNPARKITYHQHEVETWYVNGDLQINP